MQEKNFISIIKNILKSNYIGDDCAYLKDLGLVVSQDSLVEDVHFRRKWITPFQLGYKSVMVNVSDIAASGAEPAYLTVALSLPNDIDEKFVKEFYEGANSACGEKIQIVGGDITGSDKIFISICAIGKTAGRNIASRSNAQVGQKIIVSGVHGSSAAGLLILQQHKTSSLIKSHLEPIAQIDFAQKIATNVKSKYAMTDSSDGLMEALSLIANESNVLISIDFDKIPHDKEVGKFENWYNLVLFGGEDYQIVATVPQDYTEGFVIGEVKSGIGIELNIGGKTIYYSKQDVDNKTFNHFK